MRLKWEDSWLIGAAAAIVVALWLSGRHVQVALPSQPPDFQGLLDSAVHGAVKADYSDLADVTVGATQYHCKVQPGLPVRVAATDPAAAALMATDEWCAVAVVPFYEYGSPEQHLRTVLLHRQGGRWMPVAVGTSRGWNQRALRSAHIPAEVLRQAGISRAEAPRERTRRVARSSD